MTDRDKSDIPVTTCKTVTNSKIEHTRHGVVRTEVTSKKGRGGKK